MSWGTFWTAISAVATCGATITALVLAGYRKEFEAWLNPEKLNLDFEAREPFVQHYSQGGRDYIVRLRVINDRDYHASKKVSVWMDELLCISEDRTLSSFVGFMPTPLNWMHEAQNGGALNTIVARQGRFLDLGYIQFEPVVRMIEETIESILVRFQVSAAVPTEGAWHILPAGDYRAYLRVYTNRGWKSTYTVEFGFRNINLEPALQTFEGSQESSSLERCRFYFRLC